MLLGGSAPPSIMRRNWLSIAVATPAVLVAMLYMYRNRHGLNVLGFATTDSPIIGTVVVAGHRALPLGSQRVAVVRGAVDLATTRPLSVRARGQEC